MDFRWIPPGEMSRQAMRDSTGLIANRASKIENSRGFWMSSCEVSRGVWRRVMNPEDTEPLEKADFPVDSVSWWDCMDFIKRLGNPGRGWTYDLPTEVQWEFACRAGSPAEFYGDPMQIGWLNGNSDGGTHPVAQLAPNEWGLYDMHGNVAEWCLGSPEGKASERIIRGGSWCSDLYAQASVINSDVAGLKINQVGFRLVIRRDDP